MVKNDAGDTDLIPMVGLISGLISLGWVGKISGRRAWQPTQYSCLENPCAEKPGRPRSIGLQRV